MLSQMMRAVAGGSGPADVTYLGSFTSTSSLSTYTYSNVSVPRAGILCIVFLARGTSWRHVSSVTVDGDDANLRAGVLTSGDAINEKLCVADKEVSSGTYNVGVALSGSNGTSSNVRIACYLIEKTQSSTPVQAGYFSGSENPRNVALNISAGGVAVYGMVVGLGTDGIEWSSASEDADNGASAVAHKKSPTALTPHTETITADYAFSTKRPVVAVSYR